MLLSRVMSTWCAYNREHHPALGGAKARRAVLVLYDIVEKWLTLLN
jgi:hypothetical protein